MIRSCLIPCLMLAVWSDLTGAQGVDTGDWISRAPLPTPRQEMPHAVLDGRVYVIGGLDNVPTGSTVVEAFDPATNSWETRARMPIPLHHHGVSVVGGKLYVLGGYLRNTFNSTTDFFAYDASTDTWTTLDPMPTSRGAHATAVLDGKIYVAGGVSFGQVLRSVERYDPVAGAWETVAPMIGVREHHTAAAVDSVLYVIGGRVPGLGNIATVESYNPATNEWTSRTSMPTARSGLASASLKGRIFVFGGEIPGVYAQNEMYDPLTDTWETMTPMPIGRHGIGAGVIGDTIFVIGGAPNQGLGLTDVNQGFVPPASIITGILTNGVPGSDFEVVIYPNPASASITIQVRASESAAVDISLVDVLGRIVRITSADLATGGSTEIRLHTADLPSGIYFVRTGISVNPGAPGDLARETVGSVVLMPRR